MGITPEKIFVAYFLKFKIYVAKFQPYCYMEL